MRSCSSGWAAVIEAITTAGTPTTDCVERAGTADIADSRFESDSDPAQLVFAILPSFQLALLHLNPDWCQDPERQERSAPRRKNGTKLRKAIPV